MSLCKVWNDNVFEYVEKFRGRTILIPPKKFIEMDYDEAIIFKGTFAPIELDGGGSQKPESFKMIRIEVDEPKKQKIDFYRCQACNYRGKSMVDLDKHITDEHLDLMVEEEERDKRKKK